MTDKKYVRVELTLEIPVNDFDRYPGKNIASIAYEAGRKSALKERDADDNPLQLAKHPQQ